MPDTSNQSMAIKGADAHPEKVGGHNEADKLSGDAFDCEAKREICPQQAYSCHEQKDRSVKRYERSNYNVHLRMWSMSKPAPDCRSIAP